MSVTFTLELRGKPLRHTYVSHFDFFRLPQTLVFRTNAEGRVTVANANAVTTNPAGPNGPITVTVHAQNNVVRVLDGTWPIPVEVTRNFEVREGGTININTDSEQQDHFRVMEACRLAYETVFRQYRPFNRRSRSLFPLGQSGSIAATRSRTKRLEVVYPDRGVQPESYVEPISLGTGYPLIHLKENFMAPAPIAHELAHALHFSLMSGTTRASVEAQYLAWLSGRVTAGLPAFHNTMLATTPFIAWVEAFGLFAERFYRFSVGAGAQLEGAERRRAFFRDELSSNRSLGGAQVGKVDETGSVEPIARGDNVEGAVYGAIFLDFARRVGLREAVGQFLGSASENVLRFDDFRNLIITETDFDADIVAVANTWGL